MHFLGLPSHSHSHKDIFYNSARHTTHCSTQGAHITTVYTQHTAHGAIYAFPSTVVIRRGVHEVGQPEVPTVAPVHLDPCPPVGQNLLLVVDVELVGEVSLEGREERQEREGREEREEREGRREEGEEVSRPAIRSCPVWRAKFFFLIITSTCESTL